MKVIRKSLSDLSEKDYYNKHLQIINQILPVQMTNKEVEVLASFMSLGGDIIKKDRLGTTARKIVMNQLSISPGGLGNYLKSLKNKGFIFYNDFNVLVIKEILFPEKERQGYQFKIEQNIIEKKKTIVEEDTEGKIIKLEEIEE